jgi:hypothetical protein
VIRNLKGQTMINRDDLDFTATDVLANQVAVLGTATDFDTITIGGNDARFAPVLQTCTAAEADPTCICRSQRGGGLREVRITGPIGAHVQRDPRRHTARPSSGAGLFPAVRAHAKLRRPTGAQPGPPSKAQRGRRCHGVCSANPWVNGPSVSPSVGPYHPNQTGYHDGYLPALDVTTEHQLSASRHGTERALPPRIDVSHNG